MSTAETAPGHTADFAEESGPFARGFQPLPATQRALALLDEQLSSHSPDEPSGLHDCDHSLGPGCQFDRSLPRGDSEYSGASTKSSGDLPVVDEREMPGGPD